MKHIQPTSSRCLHPICSARSRNYRGNFYITVQEADGEERRVSKLLYPGWKKLTTAKRVAEEMLHAWDLNIGRASWALPHILRIYDNTTLIEAHYWNRQNAELHRPCEAGSVARSGSPAKRESSPPQHEVPQSPAKRGIA